MLNIALAGILSWEVRVFAKGRQFTRGEGRFVNEENLCLLPADKEGVFMVFPEESFRRKAIDAVTTAFSRHDNLSLNRVEWAARKILTH